jgi:hypothetical protein
METLTLLAICLIPAAFVHGWYTGKKTGIESFLGFVYDKRDKFGHTMMKFPDKDTVEFVDPLEYNKAILRAIDEAVEEAQSTREV